MLYPNGTAQNYFKAQAADDCYQKAVKPDYILPGRAWIDFKFRVSYRESKNIAWKPSALYSSLRKYIDHSSNSTKRLIIVYGKLHGTINDVQFPIKRGAKILLHDKSEFDDRVQFVFALKAIDKLKGSNDDWIYDKVSTLLKRVHG